MRASETWSEGTACAAALAAISALALAAAPAMFAQAPPSAATAPSHKWTAPRTPDGHPDLQGIWTNATITPFERPAELAQKEFFTPAEAAEYERAWAARNNQDRRETDHVADIGTGYNAAWWDRGTKVVPTLRTSLVVDPPDGRIPALTEAARKRLAARAAELAERCKNPGCSPGNNGLPIPADGPEDRPLTERCIIWPSAGPPMLPGGYNNNYQIVQTADTVAILVEMAHDLRIIPLDGRPHLPAGVEQWKGDSRGHWEGDTLVVDTANFTDRTRFRNSGAKLHLVERFTRTAPDTLLYRVTVEDPETFTRPWTIELPMASARGPIFEYACHETNYSMEGILSGARALERKSLAVRQ